MKIDSRLTKLELRAKRTLRCAWCRYALSDVAPSKGKQYAADPTSYITVSCPYCATPYTVDVSGLDEYGREATILYYTPERGASYRDERIFAAIEWIIHSRFIKLWKAGGFSAEKVEAHKRAKEQRAKKKLDRNARARAEIKERALSFIQRMQEQEEKEFGPHSFQLPSELKSIERPPNHFAPGTYIQMPHDEKIARQMLYRVQQMKACERVLWNKLLPETKAMMLELMSIIQKFEDERAQKAREEEEEKARRAAERERERLERLAATAKPTPEQPARRWVNGDVIDGQGYKKWS